MHRPDLPPRREDVVLRDGLGRRRFAAGALETNQTQDRQFVVRGRIGHANVNQEAVHLRLGQRIGAFLLDGVLRGEDEKQVGKLVSLSGDRHLPLFHRFQQRRLHLRGRAIDLVGQHQIAEQRTGLELERRGLLAIDFGAGHIGGQEIGRELHAAEAAFNKPGQGLDGTRLGRARQPFHQHVAIRQQRDQQPLHHRLLAQDGRIHGLGNSRQGFAVSRHGVRQGLSESIREKWHGAMPDGG